MESGSGVPLHFSALVRNGGTTRFQHVGAGEHREAEAWSGSRGAREHSAVPEHTELPSAPGKRVIRLGFLASHRGSNVEAVVDGCRSGLIHARPTVVISNNGGSGALQRAEKEGISGYCLNSAKFPIPDQLDQSILGALSRHGVDLVILAGYLKKLGPKTLQAYRGRIINIHPALLPKYGGQGLFGLAIHRAVLAAGETETGVTIHIVDEEYDHGAILVQRTVPVLPGDTPESLSERLLPVEHGLLVETVAQIVNGTIALPYGL